MGEYSPPIGFGTGELKGDDVIFPVEEALKAGYRIIDTASRYQNELELGLAVRKVMHDDQFGFNREDIQVTSKLWVDDIGYKKALDAFNLSCINLGLDYIDTYLIHWPEGHYYEAWRALEQMQWLGRVHNIGVSNFNEHQLEELIKFSIYPPAINQIEFHPFAYEQQKPIVDFCHDNGITVQGYCPLASGLANEKDTEILDSIAGRYGKEVGQILIRWSVEHGVVPLPRSRDRNHIHENINVFDFSLALDDIELINSLSKDARLFTGP